MPTAFHPLKNPVTFGEDLRENLKLVLSLAPVHCDGCSDYHIRCVAHRATGEQFGIDSDRVELVHLLGELISDRLARRSGEIDIVIAGSADTGVLATVAHAAGRLGGEALSRCRFTVLDLCLTPLLLCERFAEAHGLHFRYRTTDLTAPNVKIPADLMVLHSVFRFIPSDSQLDVLEELGSWLKSEGSMVFSNRIKTRSEKETTADLAKRGAANAAVAHMLETGGLKVDMPPEELLALLERALDADERRVGEFRSSNELRDLFERSVLSLVRFQEIEWDIGKEGRPSYRRKRVLAVARRR